MDSGALVYVQDVTVVARSLTDGATLWTRSFDDRAEDEHTESDLDRRWHRGPPSCSWSAGTRPHLHATTSGQSSGRCSGVVVPTS